MCFHCLDAAEPGTVRWDACPGHAKPKGAENLRVVWPLAGIRMQEFGSLFQEHSLESVGASCKTVRNPSSYLRWAQGGGSSGAGPRDPVTPSTLFSGLLGTEGSEPPCQRASAHRVSHPVPVTAAAPGLHRPDPKHPRTAQSCSPVPRTLLPCVHQRGAARRCREHHSASWAGIFFSPPFPPLRAARTAHGRARALTLHGERSKKRNSREGRKGLGNRQAAPAWGLSSEGGCHLPPSAKRGVPAPPDLLSGGRRRCPAPRAGCCSRRSAGRGGSRLSGS